MTIDIRRIKGLMAENEYNITSLAHDIGVSRNTLSGYFETPEKMPYGVVQKIAEILCKDAEEAKIVFFAPDFRGA